MTIAAELIMERLPDVMVRVFPGQKPGKFEFSASSDDWVNIDEGAQRIGYSSAAKWFAAIKRSVTRKIAPKACPAGLVEIPFELTDEENAILNAAADLEGRTPREQLRHSAIVHAMSILPHGWTFNPTAKAA